MTTKPVAVETFQRGQKWRRDGAESHPSSRSAGTATEQIMFASDLAYFPSCLSLFKI